MEDQKVICKNGDLLCIFVLILKESEYLEMKINRTGDVVE